MTTIAVAASEHTFVASLGAMLDGYGRLGEAYTANPALGDYARLHTGLRLVSATPGTRVALAGGRWLDADSSLAALDDLRMIYLPAFQVVDPDGLGDLMARASPLHAWLQGRHREGILIGACGASVCHLAAAGLLDGEAAAVVPRLAPAFRRLFPETRVDTATPLVVSDRLMTCGPDAANANLVLRMFADGFGMEVARALAMRDPLTAPAPLFDPTPDHLVAEAKIWIRERFARDFAIADLARQLGVTHQTLIRRFRAAGEGTPRTFAQRVRMHSAASMLVETDRAVAEIAALVGYGDVASFRQLFVKTHGMTPTVYRRTNQRPYRPGSATLFGNGPGNSMSG